MTPEFHPRSTAKASDIFIAQKENLVSFILISEGNATEDIVVPYLEVYEVQVKHKDLL